MEPIERNGGRWSAAEDTGPLRSLGARVERRKGWRLELKRLGWCNRWWLWVGPVSVTWPIFPWREGKVAVATRNTLEVLETWLRDEKGWYLADRRFAKSGEAWMSEEEIMTATERRRG